MVAIPAFSSLFLGTGAGTIAGVATSLVTAPAPLLNVGFALLVML